MSDCRPLTEDEVTWKVILRPSFSTTPQENKNPLEWSPNWAIRLTASWAGFLERAYWPECSEEMTIESFISSPLCETMKAYALTELNKSMNMTADILDYRKDH